MSEPTPGEWKPELVIIDGKRCYDIKGPIPLGGHGLTYFCEADARLIAASKDLLAACREYIEYREGSSGCIDDIARRMKAAITKATLPPCSCPDLDHQRKVAALLGKSAKCTQCMGLIEPAKD